MDLTKSHWSEASISSLGDVFTGATPPTNDRTLYGNSYPFVSPADLGEHKYVDYAIKNLSVKGFEGSRKIPKDSVLFVCIGSTIGKTAISRRELTANQQINFIIPKPEIDYEYLYYALSYIAPEIQKQAGEQAVPMINKSSFEKFVLPIPNTLKEQKAIAQALSDIDNLISISRIEKRKLEKLLAGKLVHLFSPQFQTKYRFEDTTIDELSFVIKGSARSYSDTFSPSTYPFVNGGINPSGYTDSFNCESGTVLVSEGGNSCGYVNFYRERVWSGGHSYRLKAKNELVRAEYLYYLLKFNESRIMGLRVGSGLPNVQAKDLKALSLKHCKDSTYQEIVIQELDDITSLIENSSKMLQEYEWLKQGMMHDLLTGRVRLV